MNDNGKQKCFWKVFGIKSFDYYEEELVIAQCSI